MCKWMTTVEGKDKGDVKIFALSTCIFCKRAKRLLDKLGVAYRFVNVDLLEGDEREEAMAQIKEYNPRMSFPTIIINGVTIQGYKEDQIKEALSNGV